MTEPAVAVGTPPTSPQHVAILLQHAHLNLPQAYLDELIDAYAYVERMVGRIRRGRQHADEPAYVFHPTVFDTSGV